MSSECYNIKLAIWNDKYEVICAMCKQCLITVNHDVCVLNYVNGMNSRGKKHKANVSNIANQTKHMPQVKKPKKVGFTERLASPKPSKPRMCLRWSPTGKMFDIKGNLIASSKTFVCNAYLEAEVITIACYTQNRSIIHRRFDKTPYELINGRKPDISFLYVFGTLCYPKNDREDILKLGTKGDIAFFIGNSANSCAYRVYNQKTKKIMETMNVKFDELSAMAFEQSSLKPELQSMTSGQMTMYDDHIGGQLSATLRTVLAAQAPQNVDELETQQQHVQHQPAIIDNSVPNAMSDDNMFVNPFATPSTSAAESSSSQYVDPSNMHTNQLRSDGDMWMYALMVSTMEPKNVKEAMTDPAWIESMQEEFL
ncbi:retrovirus-related pol polyprotein from transposon TNT 1-94 [Tanacetum coccineum]